jgi:hypothetical protein
VHRKEKVQEPNNKPSLHSVQHAAVFGLVQWGRQYDLSESCPSGWKRLSSEVRPLQVLFRAISLNLYSPWDVQIACQ